MDETVLSRDARRAPDRMVRASNEDREQIVRLLGEHAAAGRLTMAEFEERAAAVYSATVLEDLDRLLVDLPASRPAGDASVRSTRARALRVVAGRDGPWRSWLVTSLLCTLIWGVTSLAQTTVLYFWPIWVIGPWGVVIGSRMFGGGCARTRRAASRPVR